MSREPSRTQSSAEGQPMDADDDVTGVTLPRMRTAPKRGIWSVFSSIAQAAMRRNDATPEWLVIWRMGKLSSVFWASACPSDASRLRSSPLRCCSYLRPFLLATNRSAKRRTV